MVIFIPKTKRHERFDSSPDAAEDAVESAESGMGVTRNAYVYHVHSPWSSVSYQRSKERITDNKSYVVADGELYTDRDCPLDIP